MSVPGYFYGPFFQSLANKEVDFDSDAIMVLLVGDTYVPSQDHRYLSQVTGEVTGTAYTAGGKALTNCAISYAALVTTLDADDIEWDASTITARYAVICDFSSGNAATAPLIAYVDFGADKSSSDGTFKLTWDAVGIAQVTVAAA